MICYICGVTLDKNNSSRGAWIASTSEFIPGKHYICDKCDEATKRILSRKHNNFNVKRGQKNAKV